MKLCSYILIVIFISFSIYFQNSCVENPLESARPFLKKVEIDSSKISFFVNERYPFKAKGIFTNGQSQNITTAVTWKITNPNVGNINSLTGLFDTIGNGITNVIAIAQVSPKDPTLIISDTLKNVSVSFPKNVLIKGTPLRVISNKESGVAYALCQYQNVLHASKISSDDTLAVIDTCFVHLFDAPQDMVIGNNFGYIINDRGYSGVPIVDLSWPILLLPNKILPEYPSPKKIVIEENKNTAYFLIPPTRVESGKLVILNHITHEFIGKIDLESCEPSDMIIYSKLDKAYITDTDNYCVWVIDLRFFKFLYKVKKYQGINPVHIVEHPNPMEQKAYIINRGSTFISVVDLLSDSIKKEIYLETGHQPGNIVVDAIKNKAYIQFGYGERIGIIDIKEDIFLGYLQMGDIDPLQQPERIFIHPLTDKDYGYITDYDKISENESRIVKFNTDSDRMISDFKTKGKIIDIYITQDGKKLIVGTDKKILTILIPF